MVDNLSHTVERLLKSVVSLARLLVTHCVAVVCVAWRFEF